MALARAGMRVVAVARRQDRLEALQAAIISAGLPAACLLPVVADITREPEAAALPTIIARKWGPAAGIDVLVNVAGVARNDASLMSGNSASWVEMVSAAAASARR